jgi:hypothetical protein
MVVDSMSNIKVVALIGIIISFFVLAAGCTSNEGNPKPSAPTNTYDAKSFTIKYRLDWTKDVPKSGATFFANLLGCARFL